jgi:acyl-CoA reductase-like NAD-dependent aldehyde dehydrogenase
MKGVAMFDKIQRREANLDVTASHGRLSQPFGGYKQSGWGREMGYEAIELYTETKAVAALL